MANDPNADEFKDICTTLYCTISKNEDPTNDDIERLLKFLCDLDVLRNLEVFKNRGILSFFTCASAELIAEHFSDFVHLNINDSMSSLVRLFLDSFSHSEGETLHLEIMSFRRLLTMEKLPERYSKRVAEIWDMESQCVRSDVEADPKKPTKNSRVLFHQRGSSLVSDLWTEVERHSKISLNTPDTEQPEYGDSCTTNARHKLLAICVREFWHHNGPDIVIRKISQLPAISPTCTSMDDVVNTIKTAEELSQLIVLTSSHSSTRQLPDMLELIFPLSIPSSLEESVTERWITSISHLLKDAALWSLDYLLLVDNQQTTNDRKAIDGLLTDLSKLHTLRQHMKEPSVSLRSCEVLMSVQFATALPVLQYWDKQMDNRPSEVTPNTYSSNCWSFSIPLPFALAPDRFLLRKLDHLSQLLALILSMLPDSTNTTQCLLPALSTESVGPGDFDQPIIVDDIPSSNAAGERSKQALIFCGRPLQLILIRLAASIALQIKQLNSHSQITAENEEPTTDGGSLCDVQKTSAPMFRLLGHVIGALNHSLVVRSSLLRHFRVGGGNLQETTLENVHEHNTLFGCYLAQFITLLDYLQQQSAICLEVDRTNAQLSKLIYLLAAEISHASSSVSTGPVSASALRQLGYNMDSLVDTNSTARWVLWPGRRVFCLLGSHIINQIHSNDSTDATENFIKICWSWLLHSLQVLGSECSTDPNVTVDATPDLIQLFCLLAGQIPGLTAKKHLLNHLMTCFRRFALHIHQITSVRSMTNYYHLSSRLLVILRYILHHFYIAPNHLTIQLKPSLSLHRTGELDRKRATTTARSSHVWSYEIIQSRLDAIYAPLRVQLSNPNSLPLFYDILIPGPASSGDNRSHHSWNFPSPDGLAILSLTSQSDYDSLFAAPLCMLDTALLMKSSSDTRTLQDNNVGTNDYLLAQSSWYPFSWYQLILVWRLFEILPPSPEFVVELSTVLNTLTHANDDQLNLNAIKMFQSPSRIIYLAVFLDRIQGKTISVEPYLVSESSQSSVSNGPSKSHNTPSSKATGQEQASLKKMNQIESQLTKEIYRAVCAKNGIQEKSTTAATGSAESSEVSSPLTAPSTTDIRNLLATLRLPMSSLTMFYAAAVSHINQVQISFGSQETDWDRTTLGQLLYLSGLVQSITELVPGVLCSENSSDYERLSGKLASLCTDSSVRRKPKQRTRHAAGKISSFTESTNRGTNSNQKPDISSCTTTASIETLELPRTQKLSQESTSSTEKEDLSTPPKIEKPIELNEEQLHSLRVYNIRLSHRLLLDCVALLTSLIRSIRHELGLPTGKSDGQPKSTSEPMMVAQLTLLCPERLTCTADGATFPAKWMAMSAARRRLANSLRLAMAPFQETFSLLGSLVASQPRASPDDKRGVANHPISRALFSRLSDRFKVAMGSLCSESESQTAQHPTADTEDPESVRLASLLRISQLCFLAKVLDCLASSLASNLFSMMGKYPQIFNLNTDVDIRSALRSVAQLYLDPVSNAVGVNLVTGSQGSSVAHYLASSLLFMQNAVSQQHSDSKIPELPKHPAKSDSFVGNDESEDLVVLYLEDFLMRTIINLLKDDVQFDPSNAKFTRVLSSVCQEAIGYLEVATGHVHVVRRCISLPDERPHSACFDHDPYALLDLFGYAQSNSDPSSPASCNQPDPSLTYQTSILRLLCVILFRALNASTKYRPIFSGLARRACELCVSGSWNSSGGPSLLSYWLSTMLPSKEDISPTINSDCLWLVDLLASNAENSTDLDAVETEETIVSEVIDISARENLLFASRGSFNPKSIAQWSLCRRQYRLALYFERFTRLLVSPWMDDVNVVQQLCGDVLSEAIAHWRDPVLQLTQKASVVDRPSPLPRLHTDPRRSAALLPLIVSTLRCVSIGCANGYAHVRLMGLFSTWSEAIVPVLDQLRTPWYRDASDVQPTAAASALISVDAVQRDFMASMCISLCGIYEYVTLVTYALNSALNLDDDGSSAANDDSTVIGVPRLDLGQIVLKDQPNPLFSNDPSVAAVVRDYSRFCSTLFNCHNQMGIGFVPRSVITQANERSRDVSEMVTKTGSIHRKSRDRDLDFCADISDTEALTDSSDSCSVDELYMSLPGPLLNSRVCSYTATQQAFVDQHWYHCHSCRLEHSEGVCSVCAQVCHAGHDLSYARHSTFFCDCGASKDAGQRCRALSYRLQTDQVKTARRHGYQNLVTRFVEDELLVVYAPWLADGFVDTSGSRSILSGLQSTFGDSEDNRMSDLSDGEMQPPDDRRMKPKSGKFRCVDAAVSSLPPVGLSADTRQQPNSLPITLTPGAAVLLEDNGLSGPPPNPQLLSTRPPSGGGSIVPNSRTSSSSSSMLRRTGAVRYKLASSDLLSSKATAAAPITNKKTGVSEARKFAFTPRRFSQSRLSATDSVRSNPSRFKLLNSDESKRACKLRCAQISQFLDRLNLGTVSNTSDDALRGRRWSSLINEHPDLCHLFCLASNERLLIDRIRHQLSASGSEKFLTNLLVLLTTSNLITQASTFLLESEGKGLIAQLVGNCSVDSSEAPESAHQRRFTAMQRLLSDKREACPSVRVCDSIALPVLNMPDIHKDLWRRVLEMGRSVLHSIVESPPHGPDSSAIFEQLASGLSCLSPMGHRLSVSSVASASAFELSLSDSVNKTKTVLDSAEQPICTTSVDQAISQSLPDILSPLSTLGAESTSASNSALLLQTLVNLIQHSESNSVLRQHLSEVAGSSGGPADRQRSQGPSSALLAVMDLFAGRNVSATPSSTTIHSVTSNSVKQQHFIMCPLRTYQPMKKKCHNFLVVSGFPSPSLTATRPTGNTAEASPVADSANGSRVLLIYQIDKLFRQAARCADNGMMELTKLQAVTSLLQSRNDPLHSGSFAAPSDNSMAQRLKLLFPRARKTSQTAMELFTAIGSSGTSELATGFKPLSVRLEELPRVCVASVGFEICALIENSICPSVFAVCGAWDCAVLGVASSGQVCGRISVTAIRDDRTEQLVKAIWLPDSVNLLALLTTRSVQIFDIFENPTKPKYHFKPVEGSFCDATFIRPPDVCNRDSDATQETKSVDIRPSEWGVYLVVMAKMGSILYQKLGADCQNPAYPFYLAEWLEWSPEALVLGVKPSRADQDVDNNGGNDQVPPLTRNATTGVLGGGGVSLHYMASMGLLFHAYQSGHSVASAIGLAGLTAPTESQLRITHSFLLTIGQKYQSTDRGTDKKMVVSRGVRSPSKLVTSLLLAAHSAVNRASLSALHISDLFRESESPAPSRSPVPPVGPIIRWSQVFGGHPGLLSAISAVTPSGNKNSTTGGAGGSPMQHNRTLLLAVEPDQVWIQTIHPQLPNPVIVAETKPSSKQVTATVDSTNVTAQSTRQSDQPNSSVASTSSLSVVDSVSVHWEGHMSLAARTMTFLLTSDGQLLVYSTSPRHQVYETRTEAMTNDDSPEFSVIPGQFWLQPSFTCAPVTFACRTPDVLSGYYSKVLRGCLDYQAWTFSLPKGSLWDLAIYRQMSWPNLPSNVSTELGNSSTVRQPSIHKCLVDSPLSGPLPVDFFEHIVPTEEVEFGGADLLQLYNRDQLRRRLLTAGSPVTGAGSTVNARINREDSLLGPLATKTSSSSEVAFVIEIYNRRPADSVIVGVRIGLPAPSGEYSTRWPKFLKVFNRVVPVTPPASGSQARFVDLPLYRSEMLLCSKLLQVFVGSSSDPEGLTSVDLVTVYTACKSDIEPRHSRRALQQSGRISPITPTSPRSNTRPQPTNLESIALVDEALVRRLDRLFATGFVTIRDNRIGRDTIGLSCPPFPAAPGILTSLIALAPDRLVICNTHPGSVSAGPHEITRLIATVCELITSTLLLSIGATSTETLEQVVQTDSNSSTYTSKMLDQLNFQGFRSQVSRLISYLFLNVSSDSDARMRSVSSIQASNLYRHALNLLMATFRVGRDSASFSAEHLKLVLDRTVSDAVSLAVTPVSNSLAVDWTKPWRSTELLNNTQRLTSLIYHLASVDRSSLSNLIDQYSIPDLLHNIFLSCSRQFPITEATRGLLTPLWMKSLGVASSDPIETPSVLDGHVKLTRQLVISLIRGLYIIAMTRISTDPSSEIKEHSKDNNSWKLIFHLLTHRNLAVACAARDALSRLIMRTKPRHPMTWSDIDLYHHSSFPGPGTSTLSASVKLDSHKPRTLTNTKLDQPEPQDQLPTETRNPIITSSHTNRDGTNPYPPPRGRHRANRHLVNTGNRLRPSWLSWDGQLTFEQALARIVPEYADHTVPARAPGALDASGFLSEMIDLEQGEAVEWNRDRDIQRIIQGSQRSTQASQASQPLIRTTTNELGASEEEEEEEDDQGADYSDRVPLQEVDGSGSDADRVADHDEHAEDDEEGVDDDGHFHYDQDNDEDDDDDDDDDVDEDEDEDEGDEDNEDSEDNVVLGPDSSLSNEMAVLLAQLIASTEQRTNVEESVFLSDIPWPVMRLCNQAVRNETRSLQSQQQQQQQHQPEQQIQPLSQLSTDDGDHAVESGPAEVGNTASSEATLVGSSSNAGLNEHAESGNDVEPIPTVSQSIERVIDADAIESAIQMISSESHSRLAFQDLLEQVDEDDLFNYALQLSLRDQGGPTDALNMEAEQEVAHDSGEQTLQAPIESNSTEPNVLDQPPADLQSNTLVTTEQSNRVPSPQPDLVQAATAESDMAPAHHHAPSPAEPVEKPSCSAPSRSSESDAAESVFRSHILSRSESLDDIYDPRPSNSSSLDSDSLSVNERFTVHLKHSRALSRRRREQADKAAQLQFCLDFARCFIRNWPDTVSGTLKEPGSSTTVAVQSLVPALQLAVTLIRTLHANAAYLQHTLHCGSQSVDDDTRTEAQTQMVQQLQIIQTTLRDLVNCLVTGLMSVSSMPDSTATTRDQPTTTLRQKLQYLIDHRPPVCLELAVMHLNALGEVFARVPCLARSLKDPSSLSLITFVCKPDESTHPTETGSIPTSTDDMSVKSNRMSNELIEYCLTLLEVLYASVEKQNDSAAQSDQNHVPSELSGLPNASTDPAALGLLQSALFSIDYSTGLLNGSGCTCISSWSPLLDAEHTLDYVGNPWAELGSVIVQACLRLPRVLLLLMDMGVVAGRSATRISLRKTTSLAPELESRWCSVLYNYMELVTNPDISNGSMENSTRSATSQSIRLAFLDRGYPRAKEFAERFETEIRSLLVRIVGTKHYRQLQDIHRLAHWIQRARDTCVNVGGFLGQSPATGKADSKPAVSYVPQLLLKVNPPFVLDPDIMRSLEPFSTQLRLPYIAQREVLHTISSCLSVAYNRSHCWQRFCLRCPDTLIFLAHASLVLDREIARNMLSLIQLAISSSTVKISQSRDSSCQGTWEESPVHTVETRLALSMARHLIPSSVGAQSGVSQKNTESGSVAQTTVQLMGVSPLLFQFIRVFLCHCSDATIRNSAMHIIRAIYRSMSSQTQLRLLQLLPLIWSELPTFAPYATQFVRLTTEMLNDHPTWPERTLFLEHVVRLMLRRLEAVRRHPRRTFYTKIMHLVQPHRDGSLQATPDSATLRRIIPDLAVQRAIGTNEPSFSRSWSALASLKPPTPSPVPQVTSVTFPATPTLDSSAPNAVEPASAEEQMFGNLGCVLELEPCLMCHAKAVDEPSYVMLRWDSEPGGSRLPVRFAYWVMPTHYGKFVTHLEQAIAQQQQTLQKQTSPTAPGTTPNPNASSSQPVSSVGVAATNANHSGSTPTTPQASVGTGSGSSSTPHSTATMAVIPVKPEVRSTASVHVFDLEEIYLISQLTVKFNVLYKRPRFVRTLNIYTSDLIERATSRLVHEPWLWQKVATVHLSPNQTAVRLCFSQPSPTPSWLGSKDYATDIRFSPERLVGAPTQKGSCQGLPVRASRLIFEYADFHTIGQEAKRVCPRCHSSNLLGSTCLTCHTNVNECFRCRSINLSAGDVYLCANCGSSRYGKIEFTIVARPCYAAVEPLHDQEDRDSACRQIVALSQDLVNNTQTLAQPIQLDIAQCLDDIAVMATAGSAGSVQSISSASTAGTKSRVMPKLSSTTNDKLLLSSLVASNSPLGSVHACISRLVTCVTEATAISLDTAAITRRLWATRQSVMEFDVTQQKKSSSIASVAALDKFPDSQPHNSWPDYESLDNLFYPPVGGCYSCLLSAIYHCGRLLLSIAEHSNTSSTAAGDTDTHWLLTRSRTDNFKSTTNATTTTEPDNQGCSLLRQLITSLIDFGLSVCPPGVQTELRALIIQLTRDSPSLISHVNEQLTNRLLQAALTYGNQAHLLDSLIHNDLALLRSSVDTVLPQRSAVDTLPGHARPMDRRAALWEMRLRPLFQVILGLAKPSGSNSRDPPASPVVHAILLPLVESLDTLISHGPSSIGGLDQLPLGALGSRHAKQNLATSDVSDRQLGAKGETRPVKLTAEGELSDLIATNTIPPVNFNAWLSGSPHASYSAWCEQLRNRSRSALAMRSLSQRAEASTNQSNAGVFADVRQKALVARFAARWRAVVSELRWAKRWGIPPNQSVGLRHPSPAGPIPCDTWITAILFDPPDITARSVNACMDLLKSLSTYPIRSRKHTKAAMHGTTQTITPCKSRSIPLLNLCHKRRRLILRFLTQACLPRLDELAPARGSAFSVVTSGGSRTTPSNTHLHNAGNAFVHKFSQLVGVIPEPANTNRPSSSETADTGHAPLVPFLLTKVNFLKHISDMVEKLLSQMQRLERIPVRHWHELVAATLGSVSGTGALNGNTPSYTIALVAELLRILEPLKNLDRKHQYSLLRILLNACVCLRQTVLQRSACTVQAEEIFSSMLDQLTGVSGSQIREFLVTTLNVLAQYPLTDHQATLYLWKRMCAPICPLDTDQSVFSVSLEVWRGHEDYLLTRSRTELVSSDTRGFGPLIHDVIDYICTGNNLTTDMRLEIVCEGQILMPQLRLRDVYTQIWCSNRSNTNKPMRLLYRIPGLEADNLPYVEQLSTGEVPPEQYSPLAVLASHPHGLNDLLNRLATVQDPLQSRDLMDVIFHILKYCLKIEECRKKLIDPELRSIPVLLRALVLCLQAEEQAHSTQSTTDLRADTASHLIQVLEPILQLTDAATLSGGQTQTALETGDLNSVLQLLSCISEHPELPVISSGVARLLGLLAFGNAEKMDAIVQFLKLHLVRLKPSVILTGKESALLDCCCSLMIAIRRDSPNGYALLQRIVRETGALEICLHFLWDTIPVCVSQLEEGTTLNTSDPEIASFLELTGLPHVLQVLRASVDGSQPAESLSQPNTYHVPENPDKPPVTANSLLHFLHLLETSKSSGRVGLLAEDMLDEWAPKNAESSDRSKSSLDDTGDTATVTQVILRLRHSTAQRTRRLARAMRQKQLESLNMRMDEKGQVVVMGSNRLAEMTATVAEEKGLTCAICHEGFRNAPHEAMGIYVFVRQCPLEEMMPYGNDASQLPSPPPTIPKGYSTLSSFVIVHFSCHTNSLKSSSENRWTVAQRHNRDAKCNAILPILSPPSTSSTETGSKSKKDHHQARETVYAGHLASFMDYVMRNLNVSPGYVCALQDVKILLIRFACNRQFHQETGGGGQESNMQLLPHLMQVCLHSMQMSSSVSNEIKELEDFMNSPEAQWATSDYCWSTTGPLYRAVAALHLWSPETWRQQRVAILRRLIHMSCGRMKQITTNKATTDGAGGAEDQFLRFKAYFIFFGLIDAIYNHLFNDVSLSTGSTQSSDWCTALSNYIATSDEAILAATPRLLAFLQDDLTPIVSVDEFADVLGLLGELDVNELTSILNQV